MPRVLCKYIDCIFLEKGVCGSETIKLDPDEGCLTYTTVDEFDEDAVWLHDTDDYSEDENVDEEFFEDNGVVWMDEDDVF